MRILSVTAQKPNSTGSGVYLTELVKGFHAMGHQQGVLAGVCREDMVSLPEGVAFFPVFYQSAEMPFPVAGMSDEMPYESTIYSQMTPEMVGRFKQTFLETFRRAVEQFQPDLVLCHHLYLLTALIRRHYSGVVLGVCHGTGLRQLKKNPLERAYIREQIRGLDKIFALHQVQKQEILRQFDISGDRVLVIGSGYNDGVFRRLDLPRKKGGVIYAGKLSEKKGVLSLLKCMEHIRLPVTLELAGGAGSAAETPLIEGLARQCAHPVTFLGRLDQKSLARAFCENEVFVLPSFYEGLPLVLMEALACGLRVVCTDLPGVKDWMDENIPGNGIRYVKPPAMKNADEPLPEALPAFERDLAREIENSITAPDEDAVDLRDVSWAGVCGRILAALG